FRGPSLGALLKANGFSSVRVSSFMGISPFLAGINWKFADDAWRFDQAISRLPGVGLLLLGIGLR
ncbi:MAG TPA: hypothetical protein VHY59_04455, partial [Chthoniobacterales bacterium]|nr:hypothetical protein [Chthoniobacterales bacterium]